MPADVVNQFISEDYKTLLTYVPMPIEMIKTRLDYRRKNDTLRYDYFLSQYAAAIWYNYYLGIESYCIDKVAALNMNIENSSDSPDLPPPRSDVHA